MAIGGEPASLDVHQGASNEEHIVSSMIYDNLLSHEYPSDKPAAGLAESWEFATDGKSVTLFLRKDVKFQDGTAFDAEAVKFNFERQLDPDNEYFKLAKFPRAATNAANIAMPVIVVDPFTVRINFKQLKAVDINLDLLTSDTYAMVSPTAVRTLREKFPQSPVGTGPFQFVSWEKGQRIVLEKNPNYWRPVAIDRLTYVPIVDPDARAAALKAGTVDVVADISGDQLQGLKGDERFALTEQLTRTFWEIHLNQKLVPALKDSRVRQALNYAINKEAIVKEILHDQVVVAKGPLSTAFNEWSADAELPGFAYNPDKAKELLAQAGFPDGRGFPTLTLKVPIDTLLGGKPVPMAEAIQADWAKVGINVDLDPLLKPAWTATMLGPNTGWEMSVQVQSGERYDPDFYIQGFTDSRVPPRFNNFGWYHNDEVEALVAQQAVELDRTKRIELVKRIQQIVAFEDPAVVFVEHPKWFAAYAKSKLANVRISSFTVDLRSATRP